MPAQTRRPRLVGLLTAALVTTGGLALTPVTAGASPGSGPVAAERAEATAARVGGLGQWRVLRTGPDTYRVSWRSPQKLPIASDRPTITADGVALGVPTVEDDGRTVVTTVVSQERPDPADLDVLLSGDRLDQPGRDETGDPSAPANLPSGPQLADDPAEPGPYAVVSSDYELDPVKLPRMREPIEMVGHVVEPAPDADTGPRPLVLFLHGRHSYCYTPNGQGGDDSWPCQAPQEEIPSQLGYDYIQQVLASQGYATVSVRVNGINAQDYSLPDGGADARAQIVQRHLDHWATIAGDHDVDLDRVVLVGHSRGGEGVDRASIQIPLDAPYRVVGQVLLAPTDFGTQTAPYVPTVTVLPYCDGDVSDLQGQRFTDSARDLADDDTSLKSSVLVMGANHNFFNTEWTPGIAQAPAWDDWYGRGGVCGSQSSTRLSAAAQRNVGIAYVAGAVRLFADDAQEFLPLFDGSVVHPASIGAADVRSHAIGGGRDVRRPALDTGLSLPSGAETSFCQGVMDAGSISACGRTDRLWGQVPHWYDAGEFAPPRRELELTWSAPGDTGGLVLDEPLDLSTDRLELRAIVDPLLGDARIRLRLTDTAGGSAVITPEGDGILRALPVDRRVGKRWAQAVLADPATATGIDLARVTRIDVIGDSTDGRLWILDVAAAPATLAAVPQERLPLVSLGSVKVTEGDGPGTSTARLPFTVTGEVTRPAQLTVGIVDETQRGGRARLRLDLAPGQTEGFLRYEYPGNTIADYPVRTTSFVAYAVKGAMTDRYAGRIQLIDDDPQPRLIVSAPKRAREGTSVRVEISLSRPASYSSYYQVSVIPGHGRRPALQVADIPQRWLERRGALTHPRGRALDRAGLRLYGVLSPARPTATVMIPIRQDSRAEGAERLTLRTTSNRQGQVRRIRVVD